MLRPIAHKLLCQVCQDHLLLCFGIIVLSCTSLSQIYPSNFIPSPCHRFIKVLEDKDKVVHRLVLGSVFGLEEDKFAGASRIEKLQDDRRSQTAEESSPKDLAWEVCADLRAVSVRH